MPGPLAPVTLPNVYTLLVEMENLADPTIRFRNTFDFYSGTVPVSSDPFPQHCVERQVALIWPDCAITKVSCYNWAKGTQPYPNGMPLWTLTMSLAGTANTFWPPHLASPHTATGGEVVLRIDHSPSIGNKPGRNFHRGLLGVGDVASLSAGKWILIIAIAILQAVLDTINSASHFSDHFAGGSSTQKLVVVRYSPKTHTVHGYTVVTATPLIGVTVNKQTRKNKK